MNPWIWDIHKPSDPPNANEFGAGDPVSTKLPVYPLLWHPVRSRIDARRAPDGRVVGVEYTYDYQPSEPAFQQALGPKDIVWVPLFNGTVDNPAESLERRLAEYQPNLQAIAEIGPRVKAILCGNANAEIRFANSSPSQEHAKSLTFIETHASFLAFHARPAFAPVFEILVHDCYVAGGILRDLLNHHQSILLSFAGCSWLFEHQGDHPRIPEPRPYPTLQKYLASLNAMTGVGRLRGLRAGSAITLAEMGYSAGFAGWY